jgi:two-component sensor histidine kinase
MLASPSPNALLKTTLDLRGVVARGAAEMELLGEAKAALEKTVADRTRELNEANQRFAKALENTGIAMAQQDVDLRSLLQLLTHRTKNLLAVIMGIARQSRASTMDVDIFVARFNGRIRALAIAHDLLLNARWRDVNLWKLIDCVWRNIAPRAIDHVTLTGDDVFIGPECAQNLALAIHEMAANAIQHGRLLEADGKVHISWAPAVENETAGIELLWRETGCSSTAPSPFTGFGKSFVLVLLPRATGGRSDFCWTTDGLSWRLWLPVHHSVSKKDAA